MRRVLGKGAHDLFLVGGKKRVCNANYVEENVRYVSQQK